MSPTPFDTHEFVETLKRAGVHECRAVAHENALGNAAFATREDIGTLAIEMKAEIDKPNTEIHIMLIGMALVIGLLAILQFGALFR
uniref:DUF1640 domain-containing protein n=1 Tax=Candidatus Kentrum eta TaxID=2126337 RepID=A0A450USJ4_9GAMM|nr:MAG: hypothetical protein BECKH772A_GA0070896_1000157 [Candidatus Kentron sp. H]VFJ88291.1 MAG: hypothetical protein BECKH772B_GA0070898_1000149 [Candidatus Kentron sp. H]VFJ95508.1 MAG: hypothetical protein BECKH772C_GA0070978_1000257 [Candidatus Kentron sp. H]